MPDYDMKFTNENQIKNINSKLCFSLWHNHLNIQKILELVFIKKGLERQE